MYVSSLRDLLFLSSASSSLSPPSIFPPFPFILPSSSSPPSPPTQSFRYGSGQSREFGSFVTHVRPHSSTSTGCATTVGSACVLPASSKPVTWRMVRKGKGGRRVRKVEGVLFFVSSLFPLFFSLFSPSHPPFFLSPLFLSSLGAMVVSSMQAPWPVCVCNSQPHRPSSLIIAQIMPANGKLLHVVHEVRKLPKMKCACYRNLSDADKSA